MIVLMTTLVHMSVVLRMVTLMMFFNILVTCIITSIALFSVFVSCAFAFGAFVNCKLHWR